MMKGRSMLMLLVWMSLTTAEVTQGNNSKVTIIPEPFADLHGFCSTCAPSRPSSVDPLVRYTWPSLDPSTKEELQIYRVHQPVHYKVDPPNAVANAQSLFSENVNITILSKGSLMLDWGVERAAWLEFKSPNLKGKVTASISEYNSPYPGKTLEVKQYGSTFRLETNKELYEGVRFTWLFFDSPDWQITSIELVAKIKPIEYLGSFESSDANLSKIWYTGAYGVRLNMEQDGFNSILVERGDRVAIQGDGHVTMAASLVAFAPYGLIKKALDDTNSGHVHGHNVVDQSIMAYPIYWTQSVLDWFMASGNFEGFKSLAPDVMSIIDDRIADFLKPNLDVVWMGWDDRMGNGWCGHWIHDECTREAHLAFAALVVKACRDLANSLRLAKMPEYHKYNRITTQLSQKLRLVKEWPQGFGVHAAANAINSGAAMEQDTDAFFQTALNDSVSICSLSPFNQYWILQGLGNADKIEHAIASIKLCWEPMIRLGKGCFWELHSPEWQQFLLPGDQGPTRPSFCHPWSSGVTAWLTHVLGGIEPLLPGYAEYVATPYVSGGNPTVATIVPTPQGAIEVNATLTQGSDMATVGIIVNASVPGFVGIRKRISDNASCVLGTVLVNGTETTVVSSAAFGDNSKDAGSRALANHFVPTRAAAFVFVRIPTAGLVTLSATYTGSRCATDMAKPALKSPGIPHIPPFPVPRYAATTKLDTVSHGNGLDKYGRDGYVLFGYDNGTDLISLPNYIQNVSIRVHGFTGWQQLEREFVGTSTTDPSYLPDPRNVWYNESSETSRSLGDVNKFDNQDILLDISVSGNSKTMHATGLNERPRKRALGMISRRDTAGWDAGSVVHIEKAKDRDGSRMASENHILDTDIEYVDTPFWLSIYCVAQDETEKHAIRVMDLSTFNVIAPTGFVSNYTNGAWFRIRYHDSIRLRIMEIHGARISAVAFAK